MPGLFDPARDAFRVDPQYQPLVRAVGLDARSAFDDPRVTPWRSLADRENCTLDETLPDGTRARLHVKRYPASAATGGETPAAVEARGHRLLADRGVPTAPLAAWGELTDGRSFTLWPDLTGFEPGDKLVARGFPFERLLGPTADVAAKLHAGGLHHRDLYLCHFLCKPGPAEADPVEVKLIDT
ncbi:MAG TPA: lipopolysaccharide kinase InaA family protein, partial [Humisphaera sp.]